MKVLIIGSRLRYEKYMPDSRLAKSAEKVYFNLGTPDEEILDKAHDADYIAVDAIGRISRNLILGMPKLKLIHSEGVAYNAIDIDTASECGVLVCRNKGINDTAVAEQTVMLMLGLLRTLVIGDAAVRCGRQIHMKESRMIEGIRELSDCDIGLIGFGDVAKATASTLQGFGCRVCYYNRNRRSSQIESKFNVTYKPMRDLLAQSDIVSLHVAAAPETSGMVDDNFLNSMRRSAFLINTSRGELVDNKALCRALTEGIIAGAGLDTVAPEPVTSDNPLLNLPAEASSRIIFSPHLGGITTKTFRRAHENIWAAFEAVEKGDKPENIVTAETRFD